MDRLPKCSKLSIANFYQTQDTLACLITSSIDDRHRPFVFHHLLNYIYNIGFELIQNRKLVYIAVIHKTEQQSSTFNSNLQISSLQQSYCQKKQINNKQMILNQDKKTFVFQREQTQQSIIIDYEIDLRQLYVNLNYLLSVYCPLSQNKVSIYDPHNNCFVSLLKIGGQNGFIAKNYLEPKVILIRYKRASDYAMDSDIQSSVQHSSNNIRSDGRVKERTIAEAIQMVKKWRNFHLHGHRSTNRRMNLQQAAKLVGVPKKSLDDYYCQLRLGQFYNFDFTSQLHQKMGVLRSYVKEYRPQKDKLRNQKHPKNLNIIQQFQLQTKSLRPIIANQKPQNLQIEQQVQIKRDNQEIRITQERFQQLSNNQPLSKQLFNLQHEFFRGFQILMDQPNDPYADSDRDFSKKYYEQESNSFLYF